MKDESAGLLAAAFIGIAPGYISRSVAGSYDNEAIAIFLLMFTFFCWIKALKTGSVLFGTLTALFYFYMVAAWGLSYLVPSSLSDSHSTLHRRLCVYHEHDSAACIDTHSHGSFQQSSVCRVLFMVRDRYLG